MSQNIPIRSLRLRAFTNTNLDSLTGNQGEVYYDRTQGTLRVYDAGVLGGRSLARADLANVSNATVSARVQASGVLAWANVSGKPTFSAVALSGSYTDLTDAPLPFSGSYTDLTNRPTLFSGSYTDLTNKPTIPTLGAVSIAGTVIDTLDSTSITFEPRVIFNSDVVVENELIVDQITGSVTVGPGRKTVSNFTVTDVQETGPNSWILTYTTTDPDLIDLLTLQPAAATVTFGFAQGDSVTATDVNSGFGGQRFMTFTASGVTASRFLNDLRSMQISVAGNITAAGAVRSARLTTTTATVSTAIVTNLFATTTAGFNAQTTFSNRATFSGAVLATGLVGVGADMTEDVLNVSIGGGPGAINVNGNYSGTGRFLLYAPAEAPSVFGALRWSLGKSFSSNDFTLTNTEGFETDVITISNTDNTVSLSNNLVISGLTNPSYQSLTPQGTTQGDAAEISKSVVLIPFGSAAAGVRLPQVPLGTSIRIRNSSVSNQNVYPPSGQDISGASGPNTAYVQGSYTIKEYLYTDTNLWFVINLV